MFPLENMNGIGGALCYNREFYTPSSSGGTLVYLNGNPDLQNVLDKVVDARGTIMVPKTEISPEYGFMTIFIDTEGNRIGLHSIPA